MAEVERADGVVNAAFSRVQGLDRYSRSAPIGKAELAAIVLQGLAELGALADWTVMPGVTESVLRLLDDDERMKYREFQESVRRAAENTGSAEEQSSSNWVLSGPAEVEIDPVPRSDSRTATLESVIGDEDLARRAAEAIVYQLYYEIVDRATVLVERSAAARERLWPLVWAVAALIPPPDTSLRQLDAKAPTTRIRTLRGARKPCSSRPAGWPSSRCQTSTAWQPLSAQPPDRSWLRSIRAIRPGASSGCSARPAGVPSSGGVGPGRGWGVRRETGCHPVRCRSGLEPSSVVP